MFGEECIYYFVDDNPYIKQNDEGKSEWVYHSELCRYDLKTDIEKSLLSVEFEVANNYYGCMLYDDMIYFIGHRYSSSSDENSAMISATNTGGEMKLYAVHLPDMQITDLGDLYDMPELRKIYPLAPNSAEVYMKGLFDNKIYFNVGFVIEENGQYNYHFYVTYYDLTDGTYHGTPEDYEHIDFAAVSYASDDYLVICREAAAEVYKKGSDQPVILKDPCFNQYADVTVYDDVLFYYDKAFDLNSGNVRQLDFMNEKEVVAKYGDSFIIADPGMQSGFEKIPAEQLMK